MSIYATLWSLKFPRYGDDYTGCEWIGVTAQGVPAHIGTPSRGFGYEEGDPYATQETQKGTARSPQEYGQPIAGSFWPRLRINFVYRIRRADLRRLAEARSTGGRSVVHARRWHSAHIVRRSGPRYEKTIN
jgi:hypothetical protein